MDVIEMRKNKRDIKKAFKLLSGAPYGKSIMDAAKRVFYSGDTHAVYPDQRPSFIDGREDKNSSWIRI